MPLRLRIGLVIVIALLVGAATWGVMHYRTEPLDGLQRRDRVLAPVRDKYAHQLYGRPYSGLPAGHKQEVERARGDEGELGSLIDEYRRLQAESAAEKAGAMPQ